MVPSVPRRPSVASLTVRDYNDSHSPVLPLALSEVRVKVWNAAGRIKGRLRNERMKCKSVEALTHVVKWLSQELQPCTLKPITSNGPWCSWTNSVQGKECIQRCIRLCVLVPKVNPTSSYFRIWTFHVKKEWNVIILGCWKASLL